MFNIPVEEVTKEQRRIAKSTGFAMLFGSSAEGLVNYFSANGVTISLKEGEQFRNAWLKTYPRIAKWHQHCKAMVDNCEPVRMVDGRRRYLTGEAKRHTIFANNTVQGSCASVMKLAMCGIHAELRNIDLTARMVGQVHDELLIECDEIKAPEVLELAKSSISQAGRKIFGSDIEMVAEGSFGRSWGEAH
jgi:DNA polymerase I-like protein with 3'-5' exonuclease and polymerase domains